MASFNTEPFSRTDWKVLVFFFSFSSHRLDNRRTDERKRPKLTGSHCVLERCGCIQSASFLFRSTSSSRDSFVLFSKTRGQGTLLNKICCFYRQTRSLFYFFAVYFACSGDLDAYAIRPSTDVRLLGGAASLWGGGLLPSAWKRRRW